MWRWLHNCCDVAWILESPPCYKTEPVTQLELMQQSMSGFFEHRSGAETIQLHFLQSRKKAWFLSGDSDYFCELTKISQMRNRLLSRCKNGIAHKKKIWLWDIKKLALGWPGKEMLLGSIPAGGRISQRILRGGRAYIPQSTVYCIVYTVYSKNKYR